MELILHRFPRDTRSLLIAPIGDIQWTGRSQDIAYRMLKEHIAECVERKAWFVGLGDYIDFASPSNRQRLRAAALYDNAEQVIDDKALELVLTLYDEILKPTAGRWLAMLEGHHYATLASGETTDHRLCQLLKAPFGGTSAKIGLAFRLTDGTRIVTLWTHHGFGGGQTPHAPLLKLEQMHAEQEGVDVYLMGHHTRLVSTVRSRLHTQWAGKRPSEQERRVHLIAVGGWMRGWVEGRKVGKWPRGSYVEQRGLRPVALGAQLIRIEPRVQYVNGKAAIERGAPSGRLFDPGIRVESW